MLNAAGAQRRFRYLLDKAPGLHDGDPLAERGDDREVVAHQHVGQPPLLPQPVQQGDDLRLDGKIKRRGRLVEEHEGRLGDERARDGDALTLPAGELVRIAEAMLGAEADIGKAGGNALVGIVTLSGKSTGCGA
jgi:hypothetical protein